MSLVPPAATIIFGSTVHLQHRECFCCRDRDYFGARIPGGAEQTRRGGARLVLGGVAGAQRRLSDTAARRSRSSSSSSACVEPPDALPQVALTRNATPRLPAPPGQPPRGYRSGGDSASCFGDYQRARIGARAELGGEGGEWRWRLVALGVPGDRERGGMALVGSLVSRLDVLCSDVYRPLARTAACRRPVTLRPAGTLQRDATRWDTLPNCARAGLRDQHEQRLVACAAYALAEVNKWGD